MALVFLGLGSNMGNREDNLAKMVDLIADRAGDISLRSGIIESEPWGYTGEKKYLNMVVGMNTVLGPMDLLMALKRIEMELGRDMSVTGYSDRPADIDILFYGDLIMATPELTIPHIRLHERDFVLRPLLEIAPGYMHPAFGLTVAELYRRFEEKGE